MLKLDPDQKIAGILAPLFCLRGTEDLGIGDTAALRELADWAATVGLGAIQILPVNEAGGDHSPYNIISSTALDPVFLSTTPAALPDLPEKKFEAICAKSDLPALRQGPVQYGAVKALKRKLLEAAFSGFRAEEKRKKSDRAAAFEAFCLENRGWLHDYAFYRTLFDLNGTEVIPEWPEAQQTLAGARNWLARLPAKEKRKIRERMQYFSYVQWVAYSQWRELRAYCDQRNVALIGDIPVGVSLYSADVFIEPDIFDASRSSGAPPERVFKADPFTEKWGQNWGFPLYRWEAMSRDNYAWWRRRLQLSRSIFDLLRVDHALGFFRIYSFPWRPEENGNFLELSKDEAMERTGGRLPCFVERDDSSLENRCLNREQGEHLFSILLEETETHRLIAEDLGEVSPYVRPVLEKLEIPGFKVPQWERQSDGNLLDGADYPRLSLATYATHDHDPIPKFWADAFDRSQSPDPGERDRAIHEMWEFVNFCGVPDTPLPQPLTPDLHKTLLRGLFNSNSWIAVCMVTDYFGLADRFNVPGLGSDANWTFRIPLPISGWNTAYASQISALRGLLRETGRAASGAP